MNTSLPMVIGHRGAAGEAPENTLASFERALRDGAEAVEFDVQLSADGIPVVFHDTTLNRTTDARGLLSRRSLSDLRKLDAGSWFGREFRGERIPTFAEALDLLRGRAFAFVEVKAPTRGTPSTKLPAAVLEELRRAHAVPWACLVSFRAAWLKPVRLPSELPGVPSMDLRRALDFDRPLRAPHSLAWAEKNGLWALCPHHALVTPDAVALWHHAGMHAFPWTVDSEEDWETMTAAGVDGMMTNHPDKLTRWFHRKHSSYHTHAKH